MPLYPPPSPIPTTTPHPLPGPLRFFTTYRHISLSQHLCNSRNYTDYPHLSHTSGFVQQITHLTCHLKCTAENTQCKKTHR